MVKTSIPVVHVYCDESRQSKERFMILGGIAIQSSQIAKFNETIANYREKYNIFGELKWQKVSKGKLKEYTTFVDYFFALINTNVIHFKAVIIDNHQLNHRKFSRGDYETGFYKFYYQLLIHCFGKVYCNENNFCYFVVHLDHRVSCYKLSEFSSILNNGLFNKYGTTGRPFRSVEACDSKSTEIIQVLDIILGAIGYQMNGHHLVAGSSEAKTRLADYIAKSAGLAHFAIKKSWGTPRFNLWLFRLRQ